MSKLKTLETRAKGLKSSVVLLDYPTRSGKRHIGMSVAVTRERGLGDRVFDHVELAEEGREITQEDKERWAEELLGQIDRYREKHGLTRKKAKA